MGFMADPKHQPDDGTPTGGGGTDGKAESGNSGSTEPNSQNDRRFTQDEVTRIAATEKHEGKKTAVKEVQERFGMSLEEAEKIVKEARERKDAEKSEAQKATEAAAKREQEAKAASALAAKSLKEVTIIKQLVLAGMNPEKVDRYARLIEVDDEATSEQIIQAVAELKKEEAHLFEASTVEKKTSSERKLPSSESIDNKKKAPAGTEDAYARGQERAKARSRQRTSYSPIGSRS